MRLNDITVYPFSKHKRSQDSILRFIFSFKPLMNTKKGQMNNDDASETTSPSQDNQNGRAAHDVFGPQYWKDLVGYAKLAPEEPAIGDFRKLQILNITHLLNRLVHIKGNIENDQTTNEEQMRLLQQTLHQYADAIRDYQSMNALSELPDYLTETRWNLETQFQGLGTPYPDKPNQPYDTRYRTIKIRKSQPRDPIREVLRKYLPQQLSWSDEEREAKRPGYGRRERPEMYSRFVDAVARFYIGTLGGCALIVPMVIMALHPSLIKSLIVVSVSVVAFALFLALIFETNNKDTIVATATYAAVLIVFVGNGATTK